MLDILPSPPSPSVGGRGPSSPNGSKRPSPWVGICRNSEPRPPEAGAGGALRAAPPALGSA
eukprot:2580838-Alexandrium_andersonii.AAC.1